jgi:hypothetical protein
MKSGDCVFELWWEEIVRCAKGMPTMPDSMRRQMCRVMLYVDSLKNCEFRLLAAIGGISCR